MKKSVDPQTLSRIMSMAEDGAFAEDIAKLLLNEEELKQIAINEGEFVDEDAVDDEDKGELFPNEIKLISQALCYRNGSSEDKKRIKEVLDLSYQCEIAGGKLCQNEGFRDDVESVSLELIDKLFDDKTLRWTLVETPNGHGIVDDGCMIGAVCYSIDGLSKCNGTVEGKLGAVRLFGVLPRFHGLMIGMRLLRRIEEEMYALGCCRCMISLPSPRKSLHRWIQRRGYSKGGVSRYPHLFLNHKIATKEDNEEISLHIYLKQLLPIYNEAASKGFDDDGNVENKVISILSINGASDNIIIPSDSLSNRDANVHHYEDGDEVESANSGNRIPGNELGKIPLPPHWRVPQHGLPSDINCATPGPTSDTDVSETISDGIDAPLIPDVD